MAQEDTNSVIELNLKAWDVRVRDLELSKKYAKESIRIADRLNYLRGLSYSYNILGNYYRAKALYDSSRFYYQKSLVIRKNLYDTVGIARSYRNIMTVEDLLGNNKKAIEIAEQGLHLLENKRFDPVVEKEKAWMKTNLGAIYHHNGNIERAIQLIHDGKTLFKKQQDEAGIAAACINMGNIYEEQMLYPKALAEYTVATPILITLDNPEELARVYNDIGNVYYYTGKLNDALIYYSKSLNIRQEYNFTDELPGSQQSMGIIYDALNKPDSATHYYQQALDQSIRCGDKEVQYESHRALGNLLYDKEDYSGSRQHLLMAERLSNEVARTTENNNLFKELSKTYSALGNSDSALLYSNQYTEMNDSLNGVLSKSIVLATELSDKEYDLKLSEGNSIRQRMFIIGMLLAILFLLVIFFLYVRFVQSKKNMQELKELVKDKELKALDAMLEGQQGERKRLATELHDTIGSMLSATKYSFKAMEKSMEKMMEENKSQYRKINSMLDETMDSVRKISHDMAAGIFTEKGLEGALSDLCQTFEQPGKMSIHLNVYGFDVPLEYNIEINLYRIVQELLSNIIKHANAREITIQLLKSTENINLTVEDDGRGFDPEEAKKKKGLGLSNIELRVKKLSGKWNIDSGKGKGSTIIIDIPIIKAT